MLASDYLRPAAVKAGVLTVTTENLFNKKGEETVKLHYWDKDGNELHRFGFHNLRHSNSSITLDKYVQTDMDELVAAQELMLDAIFQHNNRAVN